MSFIKCSFGLLIPVGIGLVAGCNSLPTNVFPMQNMSRVPAPATGTYNLPGNYYNAAPGTTQTSSIDGGIKPINGSLPTTNLAQGNNMVQPAQFVAGSNPAPIETGSFVQAANYTATNSGNAMDVGNTSEGRFDSTTTSVASDPTLKWE